MIKKIAWNTFKNTGNVNTFLELKQIQNIEQQINEIEKQNGIKQISQIEQQQMEAQNGNYQNEWNNNFLK